MHNEWHLFLLVRERIDAGEPLVSFDVVSPPLWTLFSYLPALVRSPDGTRYELSPDFPDVLHEFIRVGVDTSLDLRPGEHYLRFSPGKHHPHHNPATPHGQAPTARPGTRVVTLTSPEAMRDFFDRLPPSALPPAPDDPDSPASNDGGAGDAAPTPG